MSHPSPRTADLLIRAAVMLIIPWSVWVTHNIYDLLSLHHSGAEFTSKDAHHLEGEVRDEIEKVRDRLWDLEGEINKKQ